MPVPWELFLSLPCLALGSFTLIHVALLCLAADVLPPRTASSPPGAPQEGITLQGVVWRMDTGKLYADLTAGMHHAEWNTFKAGG